MEPRETQVTSPVAPPVTLQVREYGDRSASTHLLLVHGFPDDQLMWEPLVEALPSTWHVVTYDVRGSGRSDKPRGVASYAADLLVEDLLAVLDATVPVDRRVHLLGHDWGAIMGWHVLAAESWDPRLQGRVATCTASSGMSLDHLGTLNQIWRGRLRMLPQTLHSWYVWLFQVPWLSERLWRHGQPLLRRLATRIDPTAALLPWGAQVRANASGGLNLYRAIVLPRLRHPVAWRTSVPVQLVVATRDPWVTPRSLEGMEARCRDLTRVEVDEGHWVPRARPVELAALVTEFVRRHP